MRLSGLVVSVNYSDLLEKSIALWMAGLDSLTVVTDLEDDNSAWLAQKHGAQVFRTDAFYRNGAVLNKGLALSEAIAANPPEDWVLFFDADITPEEGWRVKVEAANPQPGFLYGAPRYDEAGKKINDDAIGYGWWALVSMKDPIANETPFFETCWSHAGVYDGKFMLKWHAKGLVRPLPIRLTHAGIGPSHNWFGRGKLAEFDAMEAQRRRLGGGWKSVEPEKIKF